MDRYAEARDWPRPSAMAGHTPMTTAVQTQLATIAAGRRLAAPRRAPLSRWAAAPVTPVPAPTSMTATCGRPEGLPQHDQGAGHRRDYLPDRDRDGCPDAWS